MKSVSPVYVHLTGLVTGSRVYHECVRQSLDFTKLMVSEPDHTHSRLRTTTCCERSQPRLIKPYAALLNTNQRGQQRRALA